MTAKYTITPHKGGRTERISALATPETKAAIQRLGISAGDLIEWAVAHYPKRCFHMRTYSPAPNEIICADCGEEL